MTVLIYDVSTYNSFLLSILMVDAFATAVEQIGTLLSQILVTDRWVKTIADCLSSSAT